jgi:hypothetical protein
VCAERLACFPAIAAPAGERDYESPLGRGPAIVNLNGHGSWIPGNDALTFARERTVSILDRTRYIDPSFIALARYALQLVLPTPHTSVAIEATHTVMTGMPAAWYADRSARTALERAIQLAASPWGGATVRVAPEAAGVYYAYVFESGRLDLTRIQRAVGIIDAGYRDVNLALFDGGRYVRGESIPGGIVAALQQIKQRITRAYGVELALHDIDAAVRAGGLRLAGVWQPLPDGTTADLVRGAQTVLAMARSLWPNGGKTLTALVLGGGGAVALGAAIAAAFPNTIVPAANLRGVHPEQIAERIAAVPQLAGARGFARAASAAGGGQ